MISIKPTTFTLSQAAHGVSLHGVFQPVPNPPKGASVEARQSWTLLSLSVHFVAQGMTRNGQTFDSVDGGPPRASRVHNALHPAQLSLPASFLATANASPPNDEEKKLAPGAHQAWLERVCGPAILSLYGLSAAPAAPPTPSPAAGASGAGGSVKPVPGQSVRAQAMLRRQVHHPLPEGHPLRPQAKTPSAPPPAE